MSGLHFARDGAVALAGQTFGPPLEITLDPLAVRARPDLAPDLAERDRHSRGQSRRYDISIPSSSSTQSTSRA